MLTQDRLKELLSYDPDTGHFVWLRSGKGRKLGAPAGCVRGDRYRILGIDGRTYLVHRLAWLYTYGLWPHQDLDHIDRDPANNRIDNLRLATKSQNMQNVGLQSNNTSGYKGVVWHKPRGDWIARVRVANKVIYLGSYDSFFDAVCARKAAELVYHPYRAA